MFFFTFSKKAKRRLFLNTHPLNCFISGCLRKTTGFLHCMWLAACVVTARIALLCRMVCMLEIVMATIPSSLFWEQKALKGITIRQFFFSGLACSFSLLSVSMLAWHYRLAQGSAGPIYSLTDGMAISLKCNTPHYFLTYDFHLIMTPYMHT